MKTYLLNLVKTLAVLGAFSATAAMTTSAHAISPQSEEVSVKIDARDLVTERGVERVYNTLARKAERACETTGTRGIAESSVEKLCARQLLSEFIADVDSVKLTSYYAAQNAAA
ncbi:MAG: UrcA family protein [Hellea sp.]